MKRNLDRLLESLREATPDHPQLPQLERLIRERLGSGEQPLFWPRFGLHVRITAVLGAFLWGIVIGMHDPAVPPKSPTHGVLIEPAEFLAASFEDFPLR